MFKRNNKRINSVLAFGLEILAILAFAVPAVASADTAGYVTPYNATRFNSVQSNDGYNSNNSNSGSYSYTPIYQSPTPVVYSSTNAGQVRGASTSRTIVKTAPAKVITTAPAETVSDLAANAVYGSNSFMPSGVLQWVFFAILVLIAVILARRVFGGKDKYHSTPLKHA